MRRLNIDKKIVYTVAIAALAVSLLLLLLPEGVVIPATAAVYAVLAALAYTFVPKRSIHSHYKRQVLLIVSVAALVYLMLYYLSGIEYGFVISQKGNLSFLSFVRDILPLTVIILSTELLRTVLVGQRFKWLAPITYLIGVVSVIVCAGGIPSIDSQFGFAEFYGETLFPALTANLLFTHLARRYGMLPGAVYRLILSTYIYVIPVYSDVPRILPAFVMLLMPVLLMLFVELLFDKKRRRARERTGKLSLIPTALIGVVMVSIVLLITCQFRYGIIVIATESMTGEINKGDAVVFESYEHIGEIEENDVIVFEENERQVVHRVVKIETVNGQRQYITKGDANEGVDPGYRTDEDIVGVVRLRVLYIGYPSLWIREILSQKGGR